MGFEPDQIRSLVSLVTDRYIIGYNGENLVTTLAHSSLFLQVTRKTIKSWMGPKLGSIRRRTYELAAFDVWKNPHRLMMGEML